MTRKLKQELKEARPKLRLVSPMSYWFVGLMGIFNLVLGALLLGISNGIDINEPPFKIITAIIPLSIWGLIFIGLGLLKLAALKANSWKWARLTLLMGVTLKSGWAVALIARSMYQPDNAFLTMFWVTIAIVQVLCYIFFLPPHLYSGKKIKIDE